MKKSTRIRRKSLITVATVCFNAYTDIKRTLQSVAMQKSTADFEYLVIDGESRDATVEVIKTANIADRIIVENDFGPYDAMNRAAQLASGDYILFMNAGDEFYSKDAMRVLSQAGISGADVIYGNHRYINKLGNQLFKRSEYFDFQWHRLLNGRISYDWIERMPCHQSTMTKVAALRMFPYDLRFSVAADHNSYFRIKQNGGSFFKIEDFISTYYYGGHSSKNNLRCIQDWHSIAKHFTYEESSVDDFFFQFMKNELWHTNTPHSTVRDIIMQSNYFDANYYLDTYSDVRQSSKEFPNKDAEYSFALEHYIIHGDSENRNPHILFNTEQYRAYNAQSLSKNTNALFHYVILSNIQNLYSSEAHRLICETNKSFVPLSRVKYG